MFGMSLQIEDSKLAIGYVVVILHWLQYWSGLFVLQVPTAISDIIENCETSKKKKVKFLSEGWYIYCQLL